MSTRVLDQEEDTISIASSLSEVHSEEESDEDSTTEAEAEAEAIQQATEKERQYLINKYAIQIPDKQEWIASWFEKIDDYALSSFREKGRAVSYNYPVNLYGYYKKKKRVGGYGVIFRDRSGKPVRASVHSSRGGSYLYYLLKGLRKGLRLVTASGRLRDRVMVRCNSDRLERLIRKIRMPTPYCRRHHLRHLPRYKTKKICRKCTRIALYDIGRGEFKQLYRILKDIMKMGKGLFDVVCMSRADNKAAYYLAKHFKKKNELKPQEFPQVLREIVWEDAYGGCMTYSASSWMTKFHQKQGEA